MKVRCYFRDANSSNNVGRVDVEMTDREYDYCPEAVYEDAIVEVQTLLWQGSGKSQTVLAIVK